MDYWKAVSCILIVCFSFVCLFLVGVSWLPLQRDFSVPVAILYSVIMIVGMMATLWARLESKPTLAGNDKHVISYVRIIGASVFLVAVLFMDILTIIESLFCIPSFFRLDCQEKWSELSEFFMLIVKIIYLGVQSQNLLWLIPKLSAGNGGLSTKGHLVNVAVNVALLIHNLIFECRIVFQGGHNVIVHSCLSVEGHTDDVIIAGDCFNGTTYIPTLRRQAEGLLRPMMSEYFFLTSSILIKQLLAMNGRIRRESENSNGEHDHSNGESIQDNYQSPGGSRESSESNNRGTRGNRKSLLQASYGSIFCNRGNLKVKYNESISGDGEPLLANRGSISGDGETLLATYGSINGDGETLLANHGSISADGESLLPNHGSISADGETLLANHGSISADGESLLANHGSISGDGESLLANHGSISADGESLRANYWSINDDHWSLVDDIGSNNNYDICVQNSPEMEEDLLNDVGCLRGFQLGDRGRASTSSPGDDVSMGPSPSNDSFRNPGGYGFYISLIVCIASILLGVAKMSHKWIITVSFDMINTGIFFYLAHMLIIRIRRALKINTRVLGNHYTLHISYGTWLFALSSCGILTQNFMKILPYFETLLSANVRDELLEQMTTKEMYEDFTLLYAHFSLIIIQFSSGIVLVLAGLIYALLLENDMETCYFYRLSSPSFRVELYRLVIWSFAYWAYRSFVAVNQAQLRF